MRPSLRSGTFLRLLALGLVTALACAAPVRAQFRPCFSRAGATRGGEAVWVLPEVTGGPLLEFVQTRDR